MSAYSIEQLQAALVLLAEIAPQPAIPVARVNHEQDTVTFAVTFKWNRPWAMDHCEVGVVARELRETIMLHFAGYEQLAELVAVETYEPREERHIGNLVRNIHLHGEHVYHGRAS